MALKTLRTSSLKEAIMAIGVGQTCQAPKGYAPRTVLQACAQLKAQGHGLYQTSMRTGVQTITRLQ